jgi:hypothetical protein
MQKPPGLGHVCTTLHRRNSLLLHPRGKVMRLLVRHFALMQIKTERICSAPDPDWNATHDLRG